MCLASVNSAVANLRASVCLSLSFVVSLLICIRLINWKINLTARCSFSINYFVIYRRFLTHIARKIILPSVLNSFSIANSRLFCVVLSCFLISSSSVCVITSWVRSAVSWSTSVSIVSYCYSELSSFRLEKMKLSAVLFSSASQLIIDELSSSRFEKIMLSLRLSAYLCCDY